VRRPPRPGEKIWVARKWPVDTLFEAQVWSHSGLWISYAQRTEYFSRLIKPAFAAGPRDHRVHRNDEGVTWTRDLQSYGVWRATRLLQNS
jgi:hypothetical protein